MVSDTYYTDPQPADPAVGFYRHRRGGMYYVAEHSVERNATTLEWMVRYQSVDHGRFNTRPLDEFLDVIDGVARFQYLGLDLA